MLLDLIDHLRCPEPHAESPLVAAIDRVEGRDVERGSLGCPICLAQYPVRDFVADFSAGSALPVAPPSMAAGAEDLDRLAAMLDARVPGGWYLLSGGWGSLAAALVASFDVRCVLLNPPPDVLPADNVSMLRVAGRIPLSAAWANGAALDGPGATPSFLAEIARTLRPAGRLLAPVTAPVPDTAEELARDDRWWVATRRPPTSTPQPLRRRSR